MPRKCTICEHEQREKIEKALVSGEAKRRIASRFGLSDASVRRHEKNHLPSALVKSKEVQESIQAMNVMAELERSFQRVSMLFDACDAYLRDPDDPGRYEIGPRADDIFVTYWEDLPSGDTIKRKEKLSILLDEINERNADKFTYEFVEIRHADPRELILKTAARLQSQLEFIAKLVGELNDQTTINILVTNPEWLTLRTEILNALDYYPDARTAVLKAINGKIN